MPSLYLLLLLGMGHTAPTCPTPGPRARQQALGKLLFFDPALSANYRRSCASCHRPQKAFTDQRIVARGFSFTRNLTRNTPTILNSARQRQFFHDGRAGSLAEVIGSVIRHPQEFNSSYDQIADRLRSSPDYARLFRLAFSPSRRQPAIRQASIDRALIAYLRQQTTRRDLGRPAVADTRGQADNRLFMTGLGCGTCHRPPFFRDNRLHQTQPGQWVKTPTLTNALLTYPYLADGSAMTLAEVLDRPFHRQALPRPMVPDELAALTRYLQTLTDTTSADRSEPTALPALPQAPRRTIGGLY